MKAYRSLPNVISIPDFVLVALIMISILGVGHHKKSYKSLFPVATFYMTVSWLFIQTIFPMAYTFGHKLAENPYFEASPLSVAKTIVNIPLFLTIPFLAFAGRALMVMQRTDPLYKDEQEEITIKQAMLKLKDHLKNTRKKLNQIKAVWQEEKEAPTSTLRKLKETIGLLLTKNQYEEQKLEICLDTKTKEKVNIPFANVFQHFLIVGPTGSGKSASFIEPVAWQAIKHILEGRKIGLTVVEPKGDLIATIANWCDILNVPYVRIDPTLGENSAKFNPLQGETYIAAEGTRAVMRKMFGKQEAFFGLVQEMAARNTILLLKHIRGDNLDLNTVRRVLRSQTQLQAYVDELARKAGHDDDLVQYFREEVLGGQKDKFQQFAMGLRLQFEDLMGNEMLERVITGDSDIDLDEHLDKGGILLVNTAMGQLGKLGDAFGTFITMHLQNAVFRRPGTPSTRTPHFLLIDEAPRYINPDFERLLAIGRSYRCACFLASQSLAQLEMEEKAAFTNVVMSNCQNKIVFGGVNKDDALFFEKEFGQEEKVYTRAIYDHMLGPQIFPRSHQNTKVLEPLFSYTDIIRLDRYRFVYRLAKGGGVGKASIGEGLLVDPDIDFAPYLKRKEGSKKTIAVKGANKKQQLPEIEPDEGFTFVINQEKSQEDGTPSIQKLEEAQKPEDKMPAVPEEQKTDNADSYGEPDDEELPILAPENPPDELANEEENLWDI